MESISEENVIVEEKNTQETPMEIAEPSIKPKPITIVFCIPETIFLIIFYIHGLNCLDIV